LLYAIGANYAHLAMGGAPKFEESQSLPEVSYADVARTMA
jgi:hypothetical protein